MSLSSPCRWLLSLLGLPLVLLACLPAGRPEVAAVSGEIRMTRTINDHDRTGIAGQVVLKDGGQPLEGAYVNIYPDTISNLLGPSQFISRPTETDGRYQLDLPPGTYYLVARKRMTGQATGPLSPGDYYSEHQRIIATVQPGRVTVADLEVVPMKAPMFFKKEVVERRTDTGIRGVMVDRKGEPVPGGFAMAYHDRDLQRLPDFASTLSDGNGQFTIFLPKGGTYYLSARIHAWDMPRHGEPYGKFGGDNPTPVQVTDGTFVEGIRIEMGPFSGEYEPGKSRRPF